MHPRLLSRSEFLTLAQTADDASTITLSALRRNRGRDKRVAVLVGGAEAVRKSLESALPYSSALEKSDILIVPLVLDQAAAGAAGSKFRASGGENEFDSAVGRPHVGMPVALNRWQEYIDTEVRPLPAIRVNMAWARCFGSQAEVGRLFESTRGGLPAFSGRRAL